MGQRTVLLTGAAGFIGSHVAEALVAAGDRVIGFDNFDPYYDPAIKHRNVAAIRAADSTGEHFYLVTGDICDRAMLRQTVHDHSIEVILHLAGLAGVRGSVAAPERYAAVNLSGTIGLLEAAREAGVENFVFASTSSVYGQGDGDPFLETDACGKPLSPYAATKRAAEMMGHSYHHLYGMPFTSLRLFTAYGPRNRPDMMAYKLLDSIAGGGEIPLYEGGDILRDWTFVADIVSGIVKAADRPMGYEVFNLGRGEPVLLTDFIAQLESHAGRRATLRDAPMPRADVPYTSANIDKARRLLGYDPTVSVPEGVAALWDAFVADRESRNSSPTAATP